MKISSEEQRVHLMRGIGHSPHDRKAPTQSNSYSELSMWPDLTNGHTDLLWFCFPIGPLPMQAYVLSFGPGRLRAYF